MEIQVQKTTQEWEQSVGAQIRTLRQSARLTQRELAERANVSLSSVQSLELGRGSSLATVVRVVRSLDRADWFEDLATPPPAVSPREQWRQAQLESRRQIKRVRSTARARTA
jgi:transcriptional regulator with XRE-family HTH domain